MILSLTQLKAYSRKNRKRIGRGDASGHGTYSTRGQKGQRARSGGRKNLRRRGLKQFLQQIPKNKGFKGRSVKSAIVNVSTLGNKFSENSLVTLQKLVEAGLVKKDIKRVKILGDGDLKKKLNVQAHSFSKSAKNAITKAGGTVRAIR